MFTLCRLFTLLAILCVWSVAFGQATGSITGTVRDDTGAVIQGANIVITDIAKRTQLTTYTNADGNYLVAGLGSGACDVTVSAAGFKKFRVNNVMLEVAEKSRVDVTLQVGAVTSEITVEGPVVTQVEAQSSELGGVVTGKEITQLQLNGRNFVQLATLVPGINNQSGQDEGTVGINGNVGFSMNGGRTQYNNWELEKKPAPILSDFLKNNFQSYIQTSHAVKRGTVEYYTDGVKMLSKSNLASVRVDQVTDQDAQQFAAKMSHLSPSRINCGLRTLRRALNLAPEWGKLEKPIKIKLAQGERMREPRSH